MAEQLEMKGKEETETPAENDRKQTRRLPLQLGSMIAQWIVLFICLIFIGLCYHRCNPKHVYSKCNPKHVYSKSPDPQTQWIYVKTGNYSATNKKHIDFKKKEGTMEILNSSIPIHCDGHYLFFLNGDITLEKANDLLTLKVYRQPTTKCLLEITCRERETKLQEVVMFELRSNDKVYMEADHRRLKKNDLMLGLIMLSDTFCSHEN